MKRSLLFVLAFLSLSAFSGDGDFALTLQGVLSVQGPQPLSDLNRTLIVRLYPNESATKCLWARSFAVSLATNGLFSVLLTDAGGTVPTEGDAGTGGRLVDAVLAAENHEPWAGLEDDLTTGEMKPRLRLSRQPRALWTLRAVSPADGFTVGGKLTASHLEVQRLTTTGDVRSPSITVVNRVETPETLNVGSALVKKDLSVAGSAALNGGVTVEDALSVTAGGVTAVSAKVGALTARNADLAAGANVSVAGTVIDFPVGSITMWSGTAETIPAGWRICDGSESTPDLRDRFLVGAGDAYAVGATGGSPTVRLETKHVPKHAHSFSYRVFGYTANRTDKTHAIDDNSKCRNWKVTATASTGGDVAHENRPPYYALYFIQRIK